jgi:hypothetical protein
VPGYAAAGWYGICAPRATPANVVDKLATTIVAIDTDHKLSGAPKGLGHRSGTDEHGGVRQFHRRRNRTQSGMLTLINPVPAGRSRSTIPIGFSRPSSTASGPAADTSPGDKPRN